MNSIAGIELNGYRMHSIIKHNTIESNDGPGIKIGMTDESSVY
jgi:hypothetical protein